MVRIKSVWLLAGTALVACGGGGGGAVTSPTSPSPPPAPTVAVQSGSVSRTIAGGTGINVDVVAQASNFTPTGTLYASASDSAGNFLAPVQVTANGNGNYTLSLNTTPNLAAGRYQGNVTLKLCSDQACNTAQAVPSVSVPYELTVMTKNSAWPGDNLTALSAISGAPDWSTFQGNNAHTGYVPIELKVDAIRLRWKRGAINSSGTGYSAKLSPLVTSNGLFFASGSNKLTAYKEQDGTAVWSYEVGGLSYPSVNPPAVSGGVVYMAAGQQNSTYMFAFDAATGTVRYRAQMSSQWDDYLPPIVVDGSVYANGGTYGGIYGFNPTGERIFFSNALSQTEAWSPTSDGTTIYAYTGDALTMFDAKTGKLLSSIKDSEFTNYVYSVGGAGVLGANGSVYGAAYANGYLNGGGIGNNLTRFDTARGFVDWRVKGVYTVTPAYAEGVLYAPNNNPYRVEARSEADAKLLWSWTPPLSGEQSFYGAPVVTKNLLFVSTNLNTYAIDLRSQKVVWSYPAPGHLAISQNGVLYIQNPDALVTINLK